MSFSDLFEIHDSMHDTDLNDNNFENDKPQSYYDEYIDYISEQDEDSDYLRYRYYWLLI